MIEGGNHGVRFYTMKNLFCTLQQLGTSGKQSNKIYA